MANELDKELVERLDTQAQQIISRRKRALLVLYYSDRFGSMQEEDAMDLYREIRQRGWDRDGHKHALDVLIHTLGGDPAAAYGIAQVIRDFASDVVFLVPAHAYSGGTLACLAGNEIRLGACAVFPP